MSTRATLGLLALLLPLGACGAPRLEGAARYGLMELDGDLLLSSDGTGASNSYDELGLGDEEGAPGVNVDFKWGAPHLAISTQSSSYSGTGTLTSEISFEGDVIPIGADVDSDLELGVHSAVITFDMVPREDIEFGLGVGLVGLQFEADFRELGVGTRVSTDETLPIPVLAARAAIEDGDWELVAAVSGLEIEVDDDKVTFIDIDAYLRWCFLGGEDRLGTSLAVGWRDTTLDLDYDEDGDEVEADLGVGGLYVALRFIF